MAADIMHHEHLFHTYEIGDIAWNDTEACLFGCNIDDRHRTCAKFWNREHGTCMGVIGQWSDKIVSIVSSGISD